MNDEKDRLPGWEKDFWATLMEDQGVTDRAGWDTLAEDEPYVSPYNVGDVLVGEIVEDEQPCITA